MVLMYFGTDVLFYFGTVVVLYFGSVVLWYCNCTVILLWKCGMTGLVLVNQSESHKTCPSASPSPLLAHNGFGKGFSPLSASTMVEMMILNLRAKTKRKVCI